MTREQCCHAGSAPHLQQFTLRRRMLNIRAAFRRNPVFTDSGKHGTTRFPNFAECGNDDDIGLDRRGVVACAECGRHRLPVGRRTRRQEANIRFCPCTTAAKHRSPELKPARIFCRAWELLLIANITAGEFREPPR
jgi:hypothetical protein